MMAGLYPPCTAMRIQLKIKAIKAYEIKYTTTKIKPARKPCRFGNERSVT
jgi:hypothetical protein